MVVAAPKPGTTVRGPTTWPSWSARAADAALRQAVVIRLIAIDRRSAALGSFAVGVAAAAARWDLGGIHSWAENMLRHSPRPPPVAAGSTATRCSRTAHARGEPTPTVLVLALFAFGYAGDLDSPEAIGLWLEQRWAEYLTAVATPVFLPIEIRELAER